MKINFERTGGFMGMKLALSLDLDEMPDEEATSLKEMLIAVGLFQPSNSPVSQNKSDGFQYDLTVEQNGVMRSVHTRDGDLTEDLQSLINDLTMRARSQRRSN
jgi:hypothetical protein